MKIFVFTILSIMAMFLIDCTVYVLSAVTVVPVTLAMQAIIVIVETLFFFVGLLSLLAQR